LPNVREATVDATSPEPIHRRDAAGVLLLAAVAALFAEWRVRAGERL